MVSWFANSEFEQRDTSAEIEHRLLSMATALDLDYFSFLVLKAPENNPFETENTLRTNYPREWINRYISNRYMDMDPVAVLAAREARPFYWGKGRFLKPFKKPQRHVFDEAGEYGICHGLSVPIRDANGGVSVFSLISHDKKRIRDATKDQHSRIFSAAFDTHELVMNEHKQKGGFMAPDVSVREKECLVWTLEGKTANEIATILGLSVSTVNHHASSATRKLGCLNKHHAAVKALRIGLIC